MSRWLQELKRRNVFRALAIYAGAAWVLVQIATQVFPFFDVPNRTVRWVVLAALLGAPVVALLSWFYELTPQGFKLESELNAQEQEERTVRRGPSRRWLALVAALAILMLGDFAFRRWQSGAAESDAVLSIAVMPFKTLAGDADSAYFTDGIQDEILTRLSKLGALKVISRTSTAHYAGKTTVIPPHLADIKSGAMQRVPVFAWV